MENPEEVLQALDEFQKIRPSEIPRELEDYLSFVAKTGDPVYQWSLIKPLFREKLVRVMTDFYESCPSLDLAPSPNIEQFNYDSMKGNLLDLLESFANAPFTVQRICELLTSPRKEYNRVDKFMRAIEKNILVVSTREPGQAARRSENGDSMINGSIDDETPTNQTHEVEMESWVKDCTTESVTSLLPIAEPIVPSKLPKEDSKEEKTDISSFIATSELAVPQEVAPTAQSVGASVVEVAGIAGDVPEAIMNEDTSSQPSLEAENEDGDASTRKLQTTFQSRDFVKDKVNKFYQEKTEEEEQKVSEDEEQEADEPVEKRARLEEEVTAPDAGEVSEERATKEEAEEVKEEVKEEPKVEAEVKPAEAEPKEEEEEAKEEEEEEAKEEEAVKPIVEEPEEREEPKEEERVVIEEAMEDDAKSVSSIVPEPIPIVEEPKEEQAEEEAEEEKKDESEQCEVNVEQLCEAQEKVEEGQEERGEKAQPESMEVDSEGSVSVFHQDEPMEEESGEVKS